MSCSLLSWTCFSSISGFFVGQRHQLAQSLPSFFAIALIATSTASAFLVHRNHPTFDLIAVQLTRQQAAVHYSNLFYALNQACHAVCYHRPVFVSPRGTVLSHKKKYGAKQVRYASGGGMNAKREEVEMRTKMKKEDRDCTS